MDVEYIQKGNTVVFEFSVNGTGFESVSQTFYPVGLPAFRFKLSKENQSGAVGLEIQIRKPLINDDLLYIMELSSKTSIVRSIIIISSYKKWKVINGNVGSKNFDLTLKLIHISSMASCSLKSLCDDADLTDIELRGVDGSVMMHKAILAASSPVLKTILSERWKDENQSYVEIKETTKETLQNLKNYIYTNTLPKDGLKELLLLASFYMMNALDKACVNSLIENTVACDGGSELFDLLEFSIVNKIHPMTLSILEIVHGREIEVEIMRDYYNSETKKSPSPVPDTI